MPAVDTATLGHLRIHGITSGNEKQAVEFKQIPMSTGIFGKTAIPDFRQSDIQICGGEECLRHGSPRNLDFNTNMMKIFSLNSK